MPTLPYHALTYNNAPKTCICIALTYHTSRGARWSSGIDAAIGARGRGSRPVYYLTVQRPWTSR